MILIGVLHTCAVITSQPTDNREWHYSAFGLVPRLSQNANCTCVESLVSFLRKHDVIEIGLKQKGNVLHVVQQTMRSTLGVYDIQPLITRYIY